MAGRLLTMSALTAAIAVWLAFWMVALISMSSIAGIIALARRPVLIIAILFCAIAIVSMARADQRDAQAPTCWQIAIWRSTYGDEAVRRAARARGATEAQIREAEKRCARER